MISFPDFLWGAALVSYVSGFVWTEVRKAVIARGWQSITAMPSSTLEEITARLGAMRQHMAYWYAPGREWWAVAPLLWGAAASFACVLAALFGERL